MADQSGIGSMYRSVQSKAAFQREVASRFGLVPISFPRRLTRLKSSKG
jgi:hypothetical protein